MSSPDASPTRAGITAILSHVRAAFAILGHYPVLLPLGLVTLCAQMTYSGVNNVSIPKLVPVLAVPHAQEGWITGAIVSTFLLSETFLRIPFGWLSDRYGRVPLILLALFGSIPSIWLGGHVPAAHWQWLFPLRWWDGMMAAALWPSVFALLSDRVPWRGRANAMGMINMMYMLALFIGWGLAGVLVARTGNPRLYFSLGAGFFGIGGLIALGALLWRPHLNHPHPDMHLEDAERSMVSALHHVVLLFITFVQNFAITLLAPFMFRYATEYLHFSLAQLALLVGVPVVGVGLLALPLSRLSDVLGRVTVVRTAFTTSAVALWMFSAFHTLPALAGSALLLAVGFAMGIPAWLAVISSLSGSKTRGVTMAGYGTVQGMAAVCGPLVAGVIWDRIGHGYIISASALTITLAALLAWFALPRRLYHIQNPASTV